ncbi:hypothetical protein ACHAQH_003559 [Verticillium albo-atrum]
MRYGDAIWARYHIAGHVHNGILEGTVNTTVLESIEEDAVEYCIGHYDMYTDALALYATSHNMDGHVDILNLLSDIAGEDATSLHNRLLKLQKPPHPPCGHGQLGCMEERDPRTMDAAPVPEMPQSVDHLYAEPLFLDFTVHEVATKAARLQFVEPWATLYVDAVRDRRYGDAIWARYHISGDVVDGVFPQYGLGKDTTVLERIEEDALEYWADDAESYLKALELYRQTKDSDGHKEVIELLIRCSMGRPGATSRGKL